MDWDARRRKSFHRDAAGRHPVRNRDKLTDAVAAGADRETTDGRILRAMSSEGFGMSAAMVGDDVEVIQRNGDTAMAVAEGDLVRKVFGGSDVMCD